MNLHLCDFKLDLNGVLSLRHCSADWRHFIHHWFKSIQTGYFSALSKPPIRLFANEDTGAREEDCCQGALEDGDVRGHISFSTTVLVHLCTYLPDFVVMTAHLVSRGVGQGLRQTAVRGE